MDFYELLKQKIAEHPVGESKVREASMATRRAYDNKPENKEKRAEWRHSEAGKASQRRRGKKYRKAHPEKIRAKSNRYYERHKEEILAKRKEKRANDAEFRAHINQLNSESYHRLMQIEEYAKNQREIRDEWNRKNPEKVKESSKKAYDKLRNDPVRWAKYLEKVRERNRKKRLSKEAA